MFRTLFFIAFGFVSVGLLGCATEDPLCTDNYCVIGEVFERDALEDDSFMELPENIREQDILRIVNSPADAEWEHLITLVRHPTTLHRFIVLTDEDGDLIMGTFVKGYDMLFVIRRDGFIIQDQFFFYQPVVPGIPILPGEVWNNNPKENQIEHRRHFRSKSGVWFEKVPGKYEATAGFNMEISLILTNEEGKIFSGKPTFGTNSDVFTFGNEPAIHEGVELEIYFRADADDL